MILDAVPIHEQSIDEGSDEEEINQYSFPTLAHNSRLLIAEGVVVPLNSVNDKEQPATTTKATPLTLSNKIDNLVYSNIYRLRYKWFDDVRAILMGTTGEGSVDTEAFRNAYVLTSRLKSTVTDGDSRSVNAAFKSAVFRAYADAVLDTNRCVLEKSEMCLEEATALLKKRLLYNDLTATYKQLCEEIPRDTMMQITSNGEALLETFGKLDRCTEQRRDDARVMGDITKRPPLAHMTSVQYTDFKITVESLPNTVLDFVRRLQNALFKSWEEHKMLANEYMEAAQALRRIGTITKRPISEVETVQGALNAVDELASIQYERLNRKCRIIQHCPIAGPKFRPLAFVVAASNDDHTDSGSCTAPITVGDDVFVADDLE